MILESQDHFDQLAELTPGGSSVRFWSRKQHPELSALVAGCFSTVNETIVSLYRVHGDLYFGIGDQEFQVKDDTTSTLETHGRSRRFRLLERESVLVELNYLSPELEIPLSLDPTPFVEEEHFDFLLFVHNVLTQPGRRNRVWSDQ